jgi:hypothetical protein
MPHMRCLLAITNPTEEAVARFPHFSPAAYGFCLAVLAAVVALCARQRSPRHSDSDLKTPAEAGWGAPIVLQQEKLQSTLSDVKLNQDAPPQTRDASPGPSPPTAANVRMVSMATRASFDDGTSPKGCESLPNNTNDSGGHGTVCSVSHVGAPPLAFREQCSGTSQS